MFMQFPTQRVIILDRVDLCPVELVDGGVAPILDESGNPILDTNNNFVFDEAYA